MNAARGETSIMIEGEPCRLCLTLGALAEIETAFECASMAELTARLSNLSARDLLTVLRALLIGGGHGEIAGRLSALPVSPAAAAEAVAEAFRTAMEA